MRIPDTDERDVGRRRPSVCSARQDPREADGDQRVPSPCRASQRPAHEDCDRFGALSAAFTAGPAFGGASLTAWLTETFSLHAPAWQLICLGACACSVTAVIATNLSKSEETGSKIAAGRACDAKSKAWRLSSSSIKSTRAASATCGRRSPPLARRARASRILRPAHAGRPQRCTGLLRRPPL